MCCIRLWKSGGGALLGNTGLVPATPTLACGLLLNGYNGWVVAAVRSAGFRLAVAAAAAFEKRNIFWKLKILSM